MCVCIGMKCARCTAEGRLMKNVYRIIKSIHFLVNFNILCREISGK